MSLIKNILVITPDYPYKKESVYPFVQNICEEFARKGYGVTVVSPQSLTSSIFHRTELRPQKRLEKIGDKEINIYQPYYFSVSFRYHDINNYLIRICLKHFFRKNNIKPDIVYCHFWSSAYAVLPFATANNIPLFVATGESNISALFSTKFGQKELCDYVSGVICVSSKNKKESIQLGLTTENKCAVIPNAVNSELFHKLDRAECRKKLGFSQDAFIIAFVGWFIDRKGPQRVASAINQLYNVKSIFIGKGDIDPQCDGILFKGALPHEDIPLYLNSADVFVLPTQREGCCNAVIEAMACGLPVISSNLPFNWDVLNDGNSIMVDPNNVEEIAAAIKLLKENVAKRASLAEGAINTASSLTIDKRVNGILNFIESRI